MPLGILGRLAMKIVPFILVVLSTLTLAACNPPPTESAEFRLAGTMLAATYAAQAAEKVGRVAMAAKGEKIEPCKE